MTELASFGRGGRQPGQFYGVHSIAVDSKGNIYTTETYEGKRIQKFVFKGVGRCRPASKAHSGRSAGRPQD
jgi:NHL repeat